MGDFTTDIRDYICSGHALLSIDTFEKDRCISEIIEVAKTINHKVYIWSVARGWTDDKGIQVCEVKNTAPVEDHLQAILEFDEGIICVLRDFGTYLKHETYPNFDITISLLDELRRIVASVRQTIVFVGPGFEIPLSLTHDIAQIDFSLPENKAIEERIRFTCQDVSKSDGSKFKLNEEMLPKIVFACKGMTSTEIVDRVALCLRKHKDLDENSIKTLVKEKGKVIQSSGLLKYLEPPDGGLSIVGGHDIIKQHVILDKPCFSNEAKEFGIEPPSGLLFAGPAGVGKSLLATAIASEMNFPLISMDVGELMSKYVGDSEANMGNAIKIIESIGQSLLFLDEIEKGFGGAGDLDGGSSRRVFGIFLKWLSDKKTPTYVIATANQVQSLPPEFLRAGRFSCIFGLDFPTVKERKEIFDIHLIKRKRNPKQFKTNELAKITEGYVGSEIEETVKLGLKLAFAQKDDLSYQHLINAIESIVPLSRTEPEKVQLLRDWCKKHTRASSSKLTVNKPQLKGSTRKVNLN